MFLQSVGLIPDNVLILSTSRSKAEERIKEKLGGNQRSESSAKTSIDENDMNIKAVRDVYKGFYCEVNTTEKKTGVVVDELAVKN
jgi:hypothetical protein